MACSVSRGTLSKGIAPWYVSRGTLLPPKQSCANVSRGTLGKRIVPYMFHVEHSWFEIDI